MFLIFSPEKKKIIIIIIRALRLKSFYNFLKKKPFYISRNENYKNNFYISWWNVCGVKNKSKQKKTALKKFIIFQELELSFPRAKALIFSYISGGNLQSRLTNKNEKFLKFL